MNQDFNDNVFPRIGADIPMTISIYRGDQYTCYQDAIEGGATYNINEVNDIFNMEVAHFHLVNSMTIQDMFGESSMMYAVHDDTQLFFEVAPHELSIKFLAEYRTSLNIYLQENNIVEDYRVTILGWNSVHGGSFAVNYTYPSNLSEEELDAATTAFIQDISRDHAEDETGSEDFLFITNILSGHQADDFKPYGHTKGHDQYNFPKKLLKFEYKLMSGSVLWCGGEYGTVMAENEDDAMELAKEEIATHFAEINRRLKGYDIIEYDEGEIEINLA